jgi:hypothetical protein
MSVRGVGRGKAGGARVGSAGGAAKASATGGAFGSKVDRSESLVGPSGAPGGNVGALVSADPVTAKAMELIRQLQSGQLKSRDEATRKLVADILREKVRSQSKSLTKRIADELNGNPRLKQTLERLWNHADEGE